MQVLLLPGGHALQIKCSTFEVHKGYVGIGGRVHDLVQPLTPVTRFPGAWQEVKGEAMSVRLQLCDLVHCRAGGKAMKGYCWCGCEEVELPRPHEVSSCVGGVAEWL